MKRRVLIHLALSLSLIAFLYLAGSAQTGDVPEESVDARADSAQYARDLGSRDPAVRQRAAEALARLASIDQKLMIEGYHLQEKNKNVRLALDWALYRTGRTASLFQIVRELDSGRQKQAIGYLSQLDTPTLLYPFLDRERNRPRTLVGLIEALAIIGDAETLEIIKPYRDRFEPGVAAAAEVASEKIERRLAETESPTPKRPRTVSRVDKR